MAAMAAHWRAPISYVRGDATYPVGEGNKIIVHVCNDIGQWGAGFTATVDNRWFKPQIAYHNYRMLYDTDELLGKVQLVKVERDIWVVNLIGANRTGNRSVLPPIRYDAVLKGLRRVARLAGDRDASVHMPRIGCGLAGGTWDQIEPLIQQALVNEGIRVTVYDLEEEGDY
jgi:O-acetyl-ADP-ribose deacetylase (regulator of RNase III)